MQTVIGLFENAYKAQKAAQELISEGFSADDIDVSVNGNPVDSSSYGSTLPGENYSNDFGSNTASGGTSSGSSMSGGTGDYAAGTASGYRAGTDSDDLSGSSSSGYNRSTGYTGSGSEDLTGTSGTTSSDYNSTTGYSSGSSTGTDSDYNSSGRTVNDEYSSNRSTDSDYTSSDRSTYDSDDDNDRNSFGDKVSRFFKNLFGGDDDNDTADRYSHIAKRTGCMVTVYAASSDMAEKAADILDDNDAIDVDKDAAQYGYDRANYGSGSSMNNPNPTPITGIGSSDYDLSGTPGYATGMTGISDDMDTETNSGRTGYTGTDMGNSGDSLNVIKEDVEITKREIETGGVRLRSRIVERPVEQTLRLREEKVTVERIPVDRPATTADFQNFKEGEIEMTEYAEVADVTKQARVVEEVKLNKEVNERTETINETARDTEVDVENVSKKGSAGKRNKNL